MKPLIVSTPNSGSPRPETFHEKIFDRLFYKAKIANLAPDEYRFYQESENMGYSYQNTIDYAREEGVKRGREIGRAEGRAEGEKNKSIDIAHNMLAGGHDANSVSKYTGLTLEEVQALQS